MNDGLLTFLITIVLLIIVFIPYFYFVGKKEAKFLARKKEAAALGHKPVAQHPLIDQSLCIGCSACVIACPEHALGVIDGIAELVYPGKCVGHGVCAEACPVSGIKIIIDSAKSTIELPLLDENYQSNIPNLYLIGELGGMALIRNAIFQGKTVIEIISDKMKRQAAKSNSSLMYDVIIVGAGAAGMSAALMAKKIGLNYLLLERENAIGGAILSYPRQKLVMTTPVEIPLYGLLKKRELSKEELLELWNNIVKKTNLEIMISRQVENITTNLDGFEVQTKEGDVFKGRHVVLAIGRRGTPKKLNVPGEISSKVAYSLIETVRYKHSRALVVGAGDSAIEAAIALSKQIGTQVGLINRGENFLRAKPKNQERILEANSAKQIIVYYNSVVQEINDKSVRIRQDENILDIENDFVFVFAGGELPTPFLKKIGIEFIRKDREITA